MPSRWEAFGLVAIEAMKYGKPVIASDRGALPEIIQDGIDGYVFGDETRLQYLLSAIKREDIGRKGIAGRKKFSRQFTKENMIQKTLLMYQGRF